MKLVLEKKEVLSILNEIGVLLELSGGNPFKVRAYSSAARALESCPESLTDLIESGRLREIKGIGKALHEKIVTLATTGELEYYSELKSQFPPGILDLLKIPNLGPRKVKILYDNLGIASIEELEKACKESRLRDLDGFGAKTEEKILKGIEHVKRYSARVLLPTAEEAAVPLVKMLEQHEAVDRVTVCGSLRRRRETIKDLDLLVSSRKPAEVIRGFLSHPSVDSIQAQGGTKASVTLTNGMNADLRVVRDDEFPFAQHYFTGSREHNTRMRARAKAFRLKMNEYGFTKEDGSRIRCKDEEEIFKKLGLDYIPPELREGLREIEWAQSGKVPDLVDYGALKGTLHCHTTASDGKSTLEEMATAARRLGYEYLGIADHSKSAAYAGGLDETALEKQCEAIDRYNNEHPEFRILKGSEVDILKDGDLDFAGDVLNELDYAVASIHSLLNLDEEAMTRRLIRAVENPGISFLGHLTGRLLLRREPYPVNVAKVIDATARNGKWIEINANPWRLDLDWRMCLEARDQGVLFCINPDAHHTSGLRDNRYGIDVARKAGLSAGDIANTRPLKEFLDLLQETRS